MARHRPETSKYAALTHSQIKVRIAQMKLIKLAYCKLNRLTWDDCQLPLAELIKMGPCKFLPMTPKQILALDAATQVVNKRGEVCVSMVMPLIGMDPTNSVHRNILQSRIRLMLAHGTFPYKVVTRKVWSK